MSTWERRGGLAGERQGGDHRHSGDGWADYWAVPGSEGHGATVRQPCGIRNRSRQDRRQLFWFAERNTDGVDILVSVDLVRCPHNQPRGAHELGPHRRSHGCPLRLPQAHQQRPDRRCAHAGIRPRTDGDLRSAERRVLPGELPSYRPCSRRFIRILRPHRLLHLGAGLLGAPRHSCISDRPVDRCPNAGRRREVSAAQPLA